MMPFSGVHYHPTFLKYMSTYGPKESQYYVKRQNKSSVCVILRFSSFCSLLNVWLLEFQNAVCHPYWLTLLLLCTTSSVNGAMIAFENMIPQCRMWSHLGLSTS